MLIVEAHHFILFSAFIQVVEFKALLKKADKDSCSVHSVPDDLIELLRPLYKSGKQSSFICIRGYPSTQVITSVIVCQWQYIVCACLSTWLILVL